MCLLLSCGHFAAAAPDLPASVSPGWSRTSFQHVTELPAHLTKEGAPDCWKAEYQGPGTAHIWVCNYALEGNAFNAVQRTETAANTVKFQEGSAFILVNWDKAGRDDITELVRAVQRSLKIR